MPDVQQQVVALDEELLVLLVQLEGLLLVSLVQLFLLAERCLEIIGLLFELTVLVCLPSYLLLQGFEVGYDFLSELVRLFDLSRHGALLLRHLASLTGELLPCLY